MYFRRYIAVPPSTIFPGKREAMIAHKNPGTATGSYGSASWLVNVADLRSAPVYRRIVVISNCTLLKG